MTETDLRWHLRQLPRDIEPERDLWPGIAARLQGDRRHRPRVRRLVGVAMAASLLLVAGLFWRAQPQSESIREDATASLVQQEARALSEEYQAALRQFDGVPVSAELAPGLETLDRSLMQVHGALAAKPDSVFLLQRLRAVYSRRLALTQRAVLG
jgi:hypothetical protein